MMNPFIVEKLCSQAPNFWRFFEDFGTNLLDMKSGDKLPSDDYKL